MQLKPSLSIDDQLLLLQQRGMQFNDTCMAKEFLSNHNYYRLNIYFHKLMRMKNVFSDGLRFEDVMGVYNFDQWLRNKLLFLLESVETRAKTELSYYLGMKYGSDCFYQEHPFNNHVIYTRIYENFQREKQFKYKENDPVVVHHEHFYGGYYPIWVIVEFLSFSSTSQLFYCLNEIDKKAIARERYKIDEAVLASWFHSLSVLRNICAHYGYIFRRNIPIKPRQLKEFPQSTNDQGNLFLFCLVLREISEKSHWQQFFQSFKEHSENLKPFSEVDYGFPDHWLDSHAV